MSKSQGDNELQELMKGVPRFNIGAFLLPPIWGPAHGIWITILYYPAWLFMDNILYETYRNPTPLLVIAALAASLALLALTIAFAVFSQPYALKRALSLGKTKEKYLSNQRKWAIGCIVGAALMLGWATYYNLNIRPFM